MPASVVLHLPSHYRRDFARRSQKLFYRRIATEFENRGVGVEVVARESGAWQRIEEDGRLHFVENGNIAAPNALNCTIAYIQGFWHADPRGVLCDSTIGDEAFDPETVPDGAARPFFRRLRKQFVTRRVSRYRQTKTRAPFPEGAIAVFLQGSSALTDRARLMPSRDMLRAVVEGAGGRPIIIKPHPLNRDTEEDEAVAELAEEGHPIRVTSANIHDILSAAAVTVSINSAVAMEGFLHRTPAILFGKTDFHHFAETVRSPDAFPAALSAALGRRWGYATYLYWYLHERCFAPAEPAFFHRLMARAAQQGFPPERFGFTLPTDVATAGETL